MYVFNPDDIDELDAIDEKINRVNTSLPGQVVSFDSTKQTCSVQPCIRIQKDDGTFVNMAVQEDVPVQMPTAGGFVITFPVQPGDYVLLVYQQRSIDTWIKNGGVVSEFDSRVHDFSDCIAIPGVLPNTDSISGYATDGIEIRQVSGTGYIKIDNAGNVEINGATDNAVNFLPLNTSWVQMIAAVNALITLYNAHEASLPAVAHTGSPVAPATPLTTTITGAKNARVKL